MKDVLFPVPQKARVMQNCEDRAVWQYALVHLVEINVFANKKGAVSPFKKRLSACPNRKGIITVPASV